MAPSSRCCRSCPRCADCPVRMIAAARRESATAALVSEVFSGGVGRQLPASVVQTLAALDAARREPVLATR